MVKRPLRVGFDLDGVLLYNPARITRPIVTFIKQIVLHKKQVRFFIPHTSFQKLIWRFFHYSSLFPNGGIDEIKQLVDEGKIEAYVISGRYAFLAPDFEDWLKKIDAKSIFTKTMQNMKDEQPFIFKQRTVRELDLDVFIEDNWDVVQKLQGEKTKIIWLYNILDRGKNYQYKFPTLKKALAYIEEKLL